MNTAAHYYMRGMGLGQASPTTVKAINAATGAAQSVVPTAVGPSVAALLGISTTAAIPIVGAAIAGISMAIEAILNSGCGQTCIETSQWANEAESYLQQNIQAYFAVSAPRPQSVQQMALANFQAIWNQLVQLCSQPGLGTAGQNCISDRQSGACKWKASPPQYPGEPAAGSCWNWWNGYYYPIQNDPNVASGSASAISALSSTISGTSLSSAMSSITSGLPGWAIPVGIGAVLLVLLL